jgi:G3E family GTPase
MPFQPLFWKSFLLNKTDMSSSNELRMLAVPVEQQDREAQVIINEHGEKQYNLYVVRGNLQDINKLVYHIRLSK